MVVIIPDKKIRNVKLTGDEIDLIIDELERVSYNQFVFFRYNNIIKKLRKAKAKRGNGR